MVDYDSLSVSNGSGDAALMHITATRAVGSMTIVVDTVANVPAKFIGTTGTLLPNGYINPATKTDFYGHVNSGNLIIDGFAPGSTDLGNIAAQVVVIKPNTLWADSLVAKALVAHNNDGSLKAAVITGIQAQVLGGGNTATNLRIAPRLSITSSTATVSPNIDTYNQYTVTAQAAALTIANPTGTPADGDIIIITIKDNGTTRAITYGTIYANISGLDSLIATVAGKWHVLGIRYSATAVKWQILSISTEA